MDDKKQKKDSLKKQSAWLLFAKTAGFGFAFILPLVIVRFLSQDAVGVYRQSFQVVTNAISILSFGVAMSAFYYLAREEEKRAAAVFNILLFHFITGGLAFFALYFYPSILGSLFQSDEMTRLAPLVGFVVWIWIFSMFLETVAVANQESVAATIFIIFAQLSKTSLMIAAVAFFGTVEAIIYAALIQGAVQTVILLFYLQSRFPGFWKAFDPGFLREQLAYALPLGLAGILWVLQTDLHTYFVGWRFSDAEFAVYAYGCFQIPLVTMLAESVNSVLIPRMSELQMRDDKREMIRLTARAMEKLSFFYFPIFVFLMITAQTFIITLFTRDYAASVPIFMVNLLLLPFMVLISDPIVRSYKELGKFLVALRVVMFAILFSALFYGIRHFDLNGIIAITVGVKILETIIAETVIFYKIGVRRGDLRLLKNIWKTAVASVLAGGAMFVFYYFMKDFSPQIGESLARSIFNTNKVSIVDFISGILTLASSLAVFAPVYLLTANFFGTIDDEERETIKKVFVGRRSFVGRIIKFKNKVSTNDHRPLTTEY